MLFCCALLEPILNKIPNRLIAPRGLGAPALTPLCHSRLFFLSAREYQNSVWKSGFRSEPVFRKTGLFSKKILVSSILSYFVSPWLKKPSSVFAHNSSVEGKNRGRDSVKLLQKERATLAIALVALFGSSYRLTVFCRSRCSLRERASRHMTS